MDDTKEKKLCQSTANLRYANKTIKTNNAIKTINALAFIESLQFRRAKIGNVLLQELEKSSLYFVRIKCPTTLAVHELYNHSVRTIFIVGN